MTTPMMDAMVTGAAASSGCRPIVASAGVAESAGYPGALGAVHKVGGRCQSDGMVLPQPLDAGEKDGATAKCGNTAEKHIGPRIEAPCGRAMELSHRESGSELGGVPSVSARAETTSAQCITTSSDTPAGEDTPGFGEGVVSAIHVVGENHGEAQRTPAHSN